MPLITPEGAHVDQLLTDYSIRYMQDPAGFVAQRIGVVKPVAHQSDRYVEYTRGYWFRSEAGPRALGEPPRRRGYGLDTTKTYSCISQWVEETVDDEIKANATPPIDPEADAVDLIMSDMLLRRELDFQSKALVASAWTTQIAGVSSAPSTNQTLQWDQSGAIPGTVIRNYQNTVKTLTGMKPNVLVLGASLAVTVIDNADYQDKVKYTGTGGVIKDASEMAQYFNVDEVVIADAIQNTADEAQNMSGAFIMDPKSALLVYRAPTVGLKTVTAVTVFTWAQLLGGNAYTPAVVFRGRDDRAHTDWFQGAMAYDIKVTAPDLGVFFSTMQA